MAPKKKEKVYAVKDSVQDVSSLRSADVETSEIRLRDCEFWHPDTYLTEYSLALASTHFYSVHGRAVAPLSLALIPVVDNTDWERLFQLRCEIESAFGVNDTESVSLMIKGIQEKSRQYHGHWFFAKCRQSQAIVGSIGWVPFQEPTLWYRLQDIDILPAYQSQGYGSQLLLAVCCDLFSRGAEVIALRALVSDWPIEWYKRFGFQILQTDS